MNMLGFFLFTSAIVTTIPILGQASDAINTPHIIVSRSNTLVDERISIRIEGLDPLQEAELEAKATDAEGKLWISSATFQANQSGSIDLDDKAPVQGSYEGVDGMGLMWSMSPASKQPLGFAVSSDPINITLQLLIDGQEIDSTTILRSWSLSGVKKIVVREEGLVGTLFIPSTSDRLPPVVMTLNGSNGGVNEPRAELLAAHGFAVFTLGYFGMEGLPSTLEHIPIEYFECAFAWLKKRSDLDGSRIGILGGSKGGELVLILGTMFPESMQAIVAIVPSSAVYPGCADTDHPLPAWLHQGIPLEPIAYMTPVELDLGLDAEHPIWLSPYFFKGMEQNPEAFRDAAIPVEKIACPLLLVSGGDDQMWPSEFYAEQVKMRCDEQGTVRCVHLNYPNAGHQIGLPFLPAPSTVSWHPVTKRWYFMGGSAKENELAKRDSWSKIIRFLEDQLK